MVRYVSRKEQNQRYYQKNKEAQRARVAAQKAANREYVRTLKESTPCSDCSKIYPWYVMDYDHLPEFEKRMDVSQLVANGYSIESIDREIAKCELVCANCHRIRTYNRDQWRVAFNGEQAV